jgi:hypothetical protein
VHRQALSLSIALNSVVAGHQMPLWRACGEQKETNLSTTQLRTLAAKQQKLHGAHAGRKSGFWKESLRQHVYAFALCRSMQLQPQIRGDAQMGQAAGAATP